MKKVLNGIVQGIKKTVAMWYMILIMGGVWMVLGYFLKIGVHNLGVMVLSYLTGAALPTKGVESIGGTIARVAILIAINNILLTLFMHKGPMKVKLYYIKKEALEALKKYNSYAESLINVRGKGISVYALGFIGLGFSLILSTILTGDGRFVNSFSCIVVFSAVVAQIVEKRGFLIAVVNGFLNRKGKGKINDDYVISNINGFSIGCLITPFILLIPMKYISYFIGLGLIAVFFIVYIIAEIKRKKTKENVPVVGVIFIIALSLICPLKGEARGIQMKGDGGITTMQFRNGNYIEIYCPIDRIEEAYLAKPAIIGEGTGYVTDDIPVYVVPDGTTVICDKYSLWITSEDDNSEVLHYLYTDNGPDVEVINDQSLFDDIDVTGCMYGFNMSGYMICDCVMFIPESLDYLYDLVSSGKRTERIEPKGALIGEEGNKLFVKGVSSDEIPYVSFNTESEGPLNAYVVPVGSSFYGAIRNKNWLYFWEYVDEPLFEVGVETGGYEHIIREHREGSSIFYLIGTVGSNGKDYVYLMPEDMPPEYYTFIDYYKIVEGEAPKPPVDADSVAEETSDIENEIQEETFNEQTSVSETVNDTAPDGTKEEIRKPFYRTDSFKEVAVGVGISLAVCAAGSIAVTGAGATVESVVADAVGIKRKRGKLHINGDVNIPTWYIRQKEELEISMNVTEGDDLLWIFAAKPMTPETKSHIKVSIIPSGNDSAVLKLKFEEVPKEDMVIYLEGVAASVDIHGEKNLVEKMVEITVSTESDV